MIRMETTTGSQSEEDAAGRARRGDRAAMEALYRQYQPSIARLCRQMIEPEEIGALVLLLASGKVRSITGADYTIDAGMAPPSRYQRPT